MEFRGDKCHGVIFRGKNPLSMFGRAWHIEIYANHDTEGLPEGHYSLFLEMPDLASAKSRIREIDRNYIQVVVEAMKGKNRR